MSYFVYMWNNHCHRVSTQLQLINIIIIIIIKVTIDVMLAYTQRNNDGMHTPSVTVDSSTVSYFEKSVKKKVHHIQCEFLPSHLR
jgi:hypothetical protein